MRTTSRRRRAVLSPTEILSLTLYKWRYTLETAGFSPTQARRIAFLRYLYLSNQIGA